MLWIITAEHRRYIAGLVNKNLNSINRLLLSGYQVTGILILYEVRVHKAEGRYCRPVQVFLAYLRSTSSLYSFNKPHVLQWLDGRHALHLDVWTVLYGKNFPRPLTRWLCPSTVTCLVTLQVRKSRDPYYQEVELERDSIPSTCLSVCLRMWKVKVTPWHAYAGTEGTRHYKGVGGQHHVSAALAPGKTRQPLYRRLGGPWGRAGRAGKVSPPPGFDHQTSSP